MELRGSKCVVVGAGVSGLAATRLLRRRGAEVVVNDRRDRDALGPTASELEAMGVTLAVGHHEAGAFEGASLIVVSPGVPALAAVERAKAAGVPVWSEIELASRFIGGTLVAVTGTNGKSTVTTWIGELVARTGRPTFVGGNLGTPLSDAVGSAAAEPGGFVVAEISSFQLEHVETFRPHVAALLNVTDDHLDRHGDFAAYAAAKGRVFRAQRAGDHAVVPAEDALCGSLARAGAATVHGFGGVDGVVARRGDAVVDATSGLEVPIDALRVHGAHNVSNACAAALVARLLGVERTAIEASLRSFAGLPHRAVLVRVVDGVRYIDDSKATNVGAAVAAIRGFGGGEGRVVLIAGGRDKGGSYAPLREALAPVARGLVLLGEARALLERAFDGATMPIEAATTLDDAVRRARALARTGDVVLLAPACSSFDMFRSYAHRGDEFVRIVQALGGGR